MSRRNDIITPELLVNAYVQGVFPMARSRHGVVEWYSPDPRGVLPLEGFRVPKSLGRRVRSGRFAVRMDTAFEQVIRACAEPRPYQGQTWINNQIIDAYTKLHRLGLAHSVEAWRDGERLVGGLYGVSLGGVFFGESMFSVESDASKVCLVHLVEHLRARGYALLDIQMVSPHTAQFGAVEVPREEYLARLHEALALRVEW